MLSRTIGRLESLIMSSTSGTPIDPYGYPSTSEIEPDEEDILSFKRIASWLPDKCVRHGSRSFLDALAKIMADRIARNAATNTRAHYHHLESDNTHLISPMRISHTSHQKTSQSREQNMIQNVRRPRGPPLCGVHWTRTFRPWDCRRLFLLEVRVLARPGYRKFLSARN